MWNIAASPQHCSGHRAHTAGNYMATKSNTEGRQRTSIELAEGSSISNVGEEAEKPQVDTIPDGGYGWICVVCNFWINAHTWGVNSVSW